MSDGMFDPGLALLFLNEEGQNDAASTGVVALVAALALAAGAGLLSLTGIPIL